MKGGGFTNVCEISETDLFRAIEVGGKEKGM